MCWGLTALCPVAWPDRRAAFCTPPLRTKPYSQADSEKDALKKKSFQIKHSLAASTVSKQTVVLNGRVQDEGQLKAPSRVLLATSSHATLCAQHHAYTHPHPNAYTQRHPVFVRSSESARKGSCSSNRGAARMETDSGEATGHAHKEES